MKYEEDLRWKKLYKEKKYEEAVDKLVDEIAKNLLMVHNYYSDEKYTIGDCDLDIVCDDLSFGRDSNDKKIKEMQKYMKFSEVIFEYEMEKNIMDDEIDSGEYIAYYDVFNFYRNKLIKMMEKIKE